MGLGMNGRKRNYTLGIFLISSMEGVARKKGKLVKVE